MELVELTLAVDREYSLDLPEEFLGTNKTLGELFAYVTRPAASHALRQNLCWALAGFGLGVGAASAYLLLGGEYLLGFPRWAAFVFYPGFAAGVQAYEWGLRVGPSQVVGVLAVGLAYATLAVLARCGWRVLKHRCLGLANTPGRDRCTDGELSKWGKPPE